MTKKLFDKESDASALKLDDKGVPVLSLGASMFDDEYWQEVGLRYERAKDLEDYLKDNFRVAKDDPELARRQALAMMVITDGFKEAVENEAGLKEWVRTSHWASAHFRCPRERGYDFLGDVPKGQTNVNQELTFWLGRWVGVYAALITAKAGLLEDYEEYFRLPVEGLLLPRSGKADLKIRDPKTGKIVPGEVKSMNVKGFDDKRYGKKVVPGSNKVPKKAHVSQLHDYIYAHNHKPDNEKTDYGLLFVFKKDNSDFVIYRVFWCDKLWADMLQDDGYVEYYMSRGQLPPRHPKGSIFVSDDGEVILSECSFPCGYAGGGCDYLHHCWAEEIVSATKNPEPAPATASNGDPNANS